MRKILLLLSVFFTFCALPAQGQFTIVTGTVKDVNGVAYAGGTISASLVVPGGTSPTLNGVGFTGSMSPIGLDSTGSFTARLADNNVVLPSGTQWKFLVNNTGAPPPLGTGPQTCTATLTITGASQSVSASFSACPALSSAPPVSSQVSVPCAASTTFTVTSSFITDFFMTMNCNVISSTMAGPFVTGTEAVFTLTQDSTGGRTFAWPTGFLNTPNLASAPGASTVATFQYCGAIGNGSACPANSWQNTDVGPIGTIQPGFLGPTAVYASAYGVSGLARWYSDATFNTATTNCAGTTVPAGTCVTTPTTERPFLCPGAVYPCSTIGAGSDVGYIDWGSNAQFGGNPQTTITTLVPRGTISQVITTNAVQVSVAATGNCTPVNADGCSFNLGPPNEDTPLQNALNAAYNACGVLVLTGWTVIETQHNNTTSKCPVGAASNDPGSGVGVVGIGGHESGVMISPNAPTNVIPLFQRPTIQADMVFKDFGVMAPETVPAVAGANGLFVNFDSQVSGLWLINWWASNAGSTNWTALNCSSVANAITNCDNNIVMNSGFTGMFCSSGGPSLNCTRNYIQGEIVGIQPAGSGPVNLSQNVVTLHQNNALNTSSGAVFFSTDDTFSKASTNSLPTVSINGSTAILTDTSIIGAGGIANSVGLSCDATSTCKIGGQSSSISSSGATSTDISNAGTMTLQNVGAGGGTTALSNSGTVKLGTGTALAGIVTNTGSIQPLGSGTGGFTGACTGVVTSATTVGIYGLGQTAATTCTSTTVGSGVVATKTGTIYALYCTATAGNQAADACTVVKNGVAQTMTCSLNGVASCTDGVVAHQVAYVQGDILGIEAIAGTATTLANVKGTLVAP